MAGNQIGCHIPSSIPAARSAAEGRSLERFADGDEISGTEAACEDRPVDPRFISFGRSLLCPSLLSSENQCPSFATLRCPYRLTWSSLTVWLRRRMYRLPRKLSRNQRGLYRVIPQQPGPSSAAVCWCPFASSG